MVPAAGAEPPSLGDTDSLHTVSLTAWPFALSQALAGVAFEGQDSELCDGLCPLCHLILCLQGA